MFIKNSLKIYFLLICSINSIKNQKSHFSQNVTMRKNDFVDDFFSTKITCNDGSFCVPFVQCPAHIRNEIKKLCQITTGREGVCCSTGQNHTGLCFS